MEQDAVYRALQKHLDKSAVGFPSTGSGSDIAILKYLFTPQEARLATFLSNYKAEHPFLILKRLQKSGENISVGELKVVLKEMLRKGTLLGYRGRNGDMCYKNAGVTAGGMYDFQVNRLTPEIMKDFQSYHEESFAGAETTGKVKIPQLRTVPVEKSLSIDIRQRSTTYDDVRQIVANAPGPLAVVNCVCRQTKDLQGKSCKYTSLRETCLQIGPDHARQYVAMGIARFVTREEIFEILDKAQQAGLILQPENSKNPEAICCCCGDCCGLLSNVKKSPRPVEMYASNYFARVDPAQCTACGTCLNRCQLEAITLVDNKAAIDLNRCIGCGNCVVTCKTGALALEQKQELMTPPPTKDSMYMQIMSRKRGKLKAAVTRTRISLGLKE